MEQKQLLMLSPEMERSLHQAEKLTNFMPTPKTDYEIVNRKLHILELTLEDLHGRGIITKRMVNVIRKRYDFMAVWSALNAEHIKENEKIDEWLRASLLRYSVRSDPLRKDIRIL